MNQLRLVYSRKANDELVRLSSVRCKMLRARSSASHETLSAKVERLERVDPDGAVVIERLVDDLLAEAER